MLVACGVKTPLPAVGEEAAVEEGESATWRQDSPCSLALDALVRGAEEPVQKLLHAFRSQSIENIERELFQIHKWLPRSNTDAEVAVGKSLVVRHISLFFRSHFFGGKQDW